MSVDRSERLGPLLAALGEEAAAIVGDGKPDGIYLYVEVGDNWISPNLYHESSDAVRWHDGSQALSVIIWEAWGQEDPGQRWCVMEYEVQDGNFDARFRFPDEVDIENMDDDRRERALLARFGDKPVVYPPLPDHFRKLE